MVAFCGERKTMFVRSLLLALVKNCFGVLQLLGVMILLDANRQDAPVKETLIRLICLTVVCMIGVFIVAYFEQVSLLSTDFMMVEDKRLHIGDLLKRVPLGLFSGSRSENIQATLTSTLASVELSAAYTISGVIGGFLATAATLLMLSVYEWRMEDMGLQKYIETNLFVQAMSLLNENWFDEHKWDDNVRSAFKKYKNKLYSEKYFDYSLILREMVEQLESNIIFRGIVADKVKYLTVDEYQDTNPVQERLISILKELGANLCVVGDDDQTIYQFRGSDVQQFINELYDEGYERVQLIDTTTGTFMTRKEAALLMLGG